MFEIDGKIALRGHNGKFLSRNHRGNQNIEAAKLGIDHFSKFLVEAAALVPVKEEIISIRWGALKKPYDMRPIVVATHTQKNNGLLDLEEDIKLKWTKTKASQTSWEHTWGLTTGITLKKNWEAVAEIGFSRSFQFDIEINYNGKTGGKNATVETLEMEDATHVRIPAGKKNNNNFSHRDNTGCKNSFHCYN